MYNFTPVPRHGYVFGVPRAGTYTEALNSDAAVYGGSGVGNNGLVITEHVASHGYPDSVRITLPPLACLILKPPASVAAREAVGEDHEEDKHRGTEVTETHREERSAERGRQGEDAPWGAVEHRASRGVWAE